MPIYTVCRYCAMLTTELHRSFEECIDQKILSLQEIKETIRNYEAHSSLLKKENEQRNSIISLQSSGVSPLPHGVIHRRSNEHLSRMREKFRDIRKRTI